VHQRQGRRMRKQIRPHPAVQMILSVPIFSRPADKWIGREERGHLMPNFQIKILGYDCYINVARLAENPPSLTRGNRKPKFRAAHYINLGVMNRKMSCNALFKFDVLKG